MEFKHTTIGIYHIITPVLKEDEIINPEALKSEAVSFIENDQFNIVIDLSIISYISSGIIGILVSLHKTVLRYSGQFGIVVANKRLLEILESTGVTNVVKVYKDISEIPSLTVPDMKKQEIKPAVPPLTPKINIELKVPEEVRIEKSVINVQTPKSPPAQAPLKTEPPVIVVTTVKKPEPQKPVVKEMLEKKEQQPNQAPANFYVSPHRYDSRRKKEKETEEKKPSSSKAAIVIPIIVVVVLIIVFIIFNVSMKNKSTVIPVPAAINESSLKNNEPIKNDTENKAVSVSDSVKTTPAAKAPEITEQKPLPEKQKNMQPVRKVERIRPKAKMPQPIKDEEEYKPTVKPAEEIEKSEIVKGSVGTIFIATSPPVADIYYEGKKIGTSNVSTLELPVGTVILTFKKKDVSYTKSFTIVEGKNKAPFVSLTNEAPSSEPAATEQTPAQ